MPPSDASTHAGFTQTDPELLPLLEELRRCEPIFHTREFGLTAAECERRMALGYWEVGASGRRYSREFILRRLEQSPPIDAQLAGWKTSDHALRSVGPKTYLLTYTLLQGDRLTHRATVWRSTTQGWVILFHQGTVVTDEQDDAAPPNS
jgi:hypothetical protein